MFRLELTAPFEFREVGARPEVLGSRLASGDPPQLQPKPVVIGTIFGPVKKKLVFANLMNKKVMGSL